MRSFITALALAATVATPAAAQDAEGRGRGGWQQRGDGRPDRGQAADPRGGGQRFQGGPGDARPAPGVGRPERGGPAIVPAPRGDRDGRPGFDGRAGADRPGFDRGDRNDRFDGRGFDGGRGGGDRRFDDRRFDGRRFDDRRFDEGRSGRGGDWNRGPDRWSRDWRQSGRYDWQRYRSANRGLYQLPRYYGPGGRDYRAYRPGFRIAPDFYNRRYWILDPWQYRLPSAWGDYRWVRYFDDVLLVDLRSGMIVDAIQGFFY